MRNQLRGKRLGPAPAPSSLPGKTSAVEPSSLRGKAPAASYPQIAQSQGITAAGAEQRHARAMRMFPELRALFPAKTRRAGARQARTAGWTDISVIRDIRGRNVFGYACEQLPVFSTSDL